MKSHIELIVLPRVSMTREKFLAETPQCSIGLDGVVLGGPFYDEKTLHANFDHHDSVVREATMSTAKQVYFAIKGGLFESFREIGRPFCKVYVNDPDQDTSLAVWLLDNYKLFEGIASVPLINRLMSLNDEWDITGGAFPRALDEKLVRQHGWVFEPYSELRRTGALANALAQVIADNVHATNERLTDYMMGQGGEKELDTRHEILYDSSQGYKIVNEIGGNEARYHLFSKGMNAFVSLVATRPDGKRVWSVGRRSRYIPFPVPQLYAAYNEAEELPAGEGWGGSDIVGGSSRKNGSKLDWKQIADITDRIIKEHKRG